MRRPSLAAATLAVALLSGVSRASDDADEQQVFPAVQVGVDALGTPTQTEVAATQAANGGCLDSDPGLCGHWASLGECEKNPEYMLSECAKSCGACVEAVECKDRDTSGSCGMWQRGGECEKNPSFMKMRCAASCGTCDWLDYKKRCPMPQNRTPAVPSGRMTETFERAVDGRFAHLSPTVISRDPWIVSFDNFLTPEEVAQVLYHGEGRYERSSASGGRKDDEFVPITSDVRTSWTTWCDNSTCTDDPVLQRIYARVSEVTQVPSENFEFLQLLRYMPCAHAGAPDCQFYRRHHDTIPELMTMQPGPRVYTFFLYLSDVDEGGGTKFDGGFTVQPKAGKAVWWPATLAADPMKSDDRTHHEALPVTKGVKYAANFWIHQFDYITPHHNGCTT